LQCVPGRRRPDHHRHQRRGSRFIGGDKKAAKPKEGFDLTYAMIAVDVRQWSRRDGARLQVKFMDSALMVEDYGKQVVWLDDVTKAAP
jgi:hypothetical protein